MYPRQKMEECEKDADCKLCHKNVDKGEEVQWQAESMDLSVKLSSKNLLQEMKC